MTRDKYTDKKFKETKRVDVQEKKTRTEKVSMRRETEKGSAR